MEYGIRKMNQEDKTEVLLMMEQFYSSDAVSTNGSAEIFESNFYACTNSNPYLEGYILHNEANTVAGYAILAKSFSTEFGKPCIWFEDLYLKEEFRGYGLIPKFIAQIFDSYTDCIFKLEAETNNSHAVYVYDKLGFEKMPYFVMIKK